MKAAAPGSIHPLSEKPVDNGGDRSPEETNAAGADAEGGEDPMGEIFTSFILISHEQAEERAGCHAASVSPVVDSRDHETEDKDADGPAADLLIDSLAIAAAPALAVVEGGADHRTDCCRGTDGHTDAGQEGEEIATDATNQVDDQHPGNPVLLEDQGSDLAQGNHVEEDMEKTAVEEVGGEKRPPAAHADDRHRAGGPKQEEAAIVGREKIEWAHRHPQATGVEEKGQNVHDHVDAYELPDQGLGVASADADQVVLPPGTGGADTAVRTDRFISADQFAAVGAEEGVFFRCGHELCLPGRGNMFFFFFARFRLKGDPHGNRVSGQQPVPEMEQPLVFLNNGKVRHSLFKRQKKLLLQIAPLTRSLSFPSQSATITVPGNWSDGVGIPCCLLPFCPVDLINPTGTLAPSCTTTVYPVDFDPTTPLNILVSNKYFGVSDMWQGTE